PVTPSQVRGGRRECARGNSMTAETQAPTTHRGILDFVTEVAAMTQPDNIHWCTGSDEEWTQLTHALESTGTFKRLNPAINADSFYAAPPTSSRTPSTPPATRSTSRGSRTGRTSAPSTRRTAGPPTTGWTR